MRRYNSSVNAGPSSTIFATAGLAGAVLLAAIGWQLGGYRSQYVATTADSLQFERKADEKPRPSLDSSKWRDELAQLGIISTTTSEVLATSSDPLATLGDSIAQEFLYGYMSLKQSGTFTPERAAELGKGIGVNIRAPSDFSMHSEAELTEDADVSKERVLVYRSDMRDALAVLINGEPPEFEIFARYVETNNPERLNELREAAERYRKAEQNSLKVVVPRDAAELHIRAVNALGSYATVINQLIRSADSPFTTLVVLRTYNEAEREMLYAFDALASYYVRKSSE